MEVLGLVETSVCWHLELGLHLLLCRMGETPLESKVFLKLGLLCSGCPFSSSVTADDLCMFGKCQVYEACLYFSLFMGNSESG